MSQFRVYGETDTGKVRDNNQDSIDWYLGNEEDVALAILADGVGGFAGGEVASRLAVESARERICRTLGEDLTSWRMERARMVWRVMDAVSAANTSIQQIRDRNREINRMGTTIVLALAHDDRLCLAHVGDSRCYRYRDGRLELLTEDHSVAQELLKGAVVANRGELPYRNILTRTLGVEKVVEPDVTMHDIEPGDLYLLCSDGLSNAISDEQIVAILADNGGLAQSVGRLVEAANAAGGSDNISVVLMHSIQQ